MYVTFEVYEIKEEKIDINDNVIKFSGVRGADGVKFGVSLELFGSIDVANSKISVGRRDVSMILAKSEVGPYWPRLLKTSQKMNFIHTDFSKWIDEDDEEEEVDSAAAAGGQDFSGMGNFDMSQFGGAGSNFDMSQFGSQFGGGAQDFEEEEEAAQSDDEAEEDNSDAVKISGLTKNNESFE